MKILYSKDDSHRLDVRTLMAIPYVPSCDIKVSIAGSPHALDLYSRQSSLN